MIEAKASSRPPYLNALACPHCLQPARVRSSRAMTTLIRQLYLNCTNVECGHTFAADITITHTISPPACPNPDVHLRQAPPRAKASNDNPSRQSGPEVSQRGAANNDGGSAKAFPIG